jgi:hypothetical protein
MQEISPQVYIETGFPGVTLGAIDWAHGLILVDSPFRSDDIRVWRSNVLNLGGGVDRLLVNLDAHLDRTLGSRSLECTVIAHEKMSQIFRNRPINFKPQGSETGSEWEKHENIGSVRWAPPEITFTSIMQINWEKGMISLEYKPGSSNSAIWGILPKHAVIFVGDAVVVDQPPFLATANIPVWIDELRSLLAPAYKNFLFVSGRGGLFTHEHVRDQIKYLERVQKQLENLASKKGSAGDTEHLIPGLLKNFKFPQNREMLYQRRLKYGLAQYFQRRYSGKNSLGDDQSF